MERALRVAVVTETYRPELNGVARTLAEIVEGLQAKGHGLQLIRPRQSDQTLPSLRSGLEELLLPALPLPTYPGQTMGWPALGTLHREWRHHRPDVVHIATEGPLGWAALQVGRQLAIPVSTDFRTNFHAYSEHYGLGWLRRLILDYLRHFHNGAQCTMVPTHSLRKELEATGFTNLRVIPRGVDTLLFTPHRRDPELRRSWGATEDTLVLLSVGRLAAEKNLETVFASYRAIRAQQPDVKLVLVGHGPLQESLRERHGEAIFAGPRSGSDLFAHYASADLFLFPSRTETYGNVTAEAMASGLAVVAFARGAAARLVRSGVNGALVLEDSDDAFVAAAVALARQREGLVTMGEASRRRALPLQWSGVVSRFERELRELIRSQPSTDASHSPPDIPQKPHGVLVVPRP